MGSTQRGQRFAKLVNLFLWMTNMRKKDVGIMFWFQKCKFCKWFLQFKLGSKPAHLRKTRKQKSSMLKNWKKNIFVMDGGKLSPEENVCFCTWGFLPHQKHMFDIWSVNLNCPIRISICPSRFLALEVGWPASGVSWLRPPKAGIGCSDHHDVYHEFTFHKYTVQWDLPLIV